MNKDDYFGIIIILTIIAIAAFGGNKYRNLGNGSLVTSPAEQQQNIQQKIIETKNKVDDLKIQLQAQEDAKTQSKYYGLVKIQYINHSGDVTSEYVTLHVRDDATTTIPITGWRLQSLASGVGVDIPKGTMLYFSNSLNTEDNIALFPGDTAYIITGASPIGENFRSNKCSGYLSQFQTFIPYFTTSCPAPRNEDLSSIPRLTINDDCFDYIYTFPSCKVQVGNLPLNFSYECKKFISEKINYSSCIDTHKSDTDFYVKEWHIYLNRTSPLWKNMHEDVVLYDNDGKIVDTLKYYSLSI